MNHLQYIYIYSKIVQAECMYKCTSDFHWRRRSFKMKTGIPQVAVRSWEDSSPYRCDCLLDNHVSAAWHPASTALSSLYLLDLLTACTNWNQINNSLKKMFKTYSKSTTFNIQEHDHENTWVQAFLNTRLRHWSLHILNV